MSDPFDPPEPPARPSVVPKRPYVKPAILSERMFYASAGCGKASPQQFTCNQIPKSS